MSILKKRVAELDDAAILRFHVEVFYTRQHTSDRSSPPRRLYGIHAGCKEGGAHELLFVIGKK